MARPRPAAPRRWQHRVGSGTVKGATPDREGTSQALDAHDSPYQPGAPRKGVHERHEKPHFKLFLTLVYTFFGTSRVYRWPTRAGEMNECMFAGEGSCVTPRSSARCRAGAHYSARCRAGGRYSVSVSSTMVKGPSFTSSTCMFAPNVPVATRETSWRASCTKYS